MERNSRLYVAIDNPKKTALLSSYTTAPVARRMLLDIIRTLKIKRQEGGIEKVKHWDDPVYYEIPNVIGMDLKSAKKSLYYYNVEYSGYGDIVIDQSPSANTRLEVGSTVRLMLGSK